MNATIQHMRQPLPPPSTPLLALLRQLGSDERRNDFAALAGTTTAYLYQLATCKRGACRSRLAKGISDASLVMHKRHGTEIITMDTLASMCPVDRN
ncbi:MULTISPECIES: hypothetical protein [Delftia]|uniref:hypothetical protein n=1 Tax=Delftia TaxID=80865 RepID=UPI0024203D39|nr:MULTISPECIES: hypothetical protein [Delftia]MDH1823723.1 hypothetical protein [Delftia tsuruhatensis]